VKYGRRALVGQFVSPHPEIKGRWIDHSERVNYDRSTERVRLRRARMAAQAAWRAE